jgi:hypothetical protein
MKIRLELTLDSGATLTVTGDDLEGAEVEAVFTALAASWNIEWEESEDSE